MPDLYFFREETKEEEEEQAVPDVAPAADTYNAAPVVATDAFAIAATEPVALDPTQPQTMIAPPSTFATKEEWVSTEPAATAEWGAEGATADWGADTGATDWGSA